MKRSRVYIFKNLEIQRVKIGISHDVDRRFGDIRRMGGCDMEVIWFSDELNNAAYIESKAHKFFRKHRHIGEWFNIDESDALSAIKKIIESDGVFHTPRVRVSDNPVVDNVVSLDEFAPSNNKEKETVKSLNISDYKRVRQGIYSDKNGKLYSIKYSDGGWSVDELSIIE